MEVSHVELFIILDTLDTYMLYRSSFCKSFLVYKWSTGRKKTFVGQITANMLSHFFLVLSYTYDVMLSPSTQNQG